MTYPRLAGVALVVIYSGAVLAWQAPVQVPDTTTQDQKMLSDVGLKSDAASLLEYFRSRTFKEADPKKMAALIQQLGEEDFQAREKAFLSLLQLGPSALVGLKQAETSPDIEIRSRAHELLTRLEAKADPFIQAATARLIAKAKPAGAAEVLLHYLPYAPDSTVIDDICKALGAVAVVDGKVEPIVVSSLKDKLPLKRGAAAEALARIGTKDQLSPVRDLLKDPDAEVRLRVAMALVSHKEKEILPVLVDLFGILSPEQLWPAEDVLIRLAGDKAPGVPLGTNQASRKECRDAWKAWLDGHKETIDLAKLDRPPTLLGYTLIVQLSNRIVGAQRISGEVYELDQNKKPMWRFEVNTYPVDAQIVGPDRVLIAEFQAGRVTERDFKGEIKWEKSVGGNPIGVQRLPNGHTFVVLQNRLVEFDAKGTEVFTLNRQNHDIFRSRKARNGDVVFVTNAGQLFRVDSRTQKILKNYQVSNVPVLFGSIDVLPSGGVLVPHFHENRVVEYDADGKQKAQYPVQWPNSVLRLPNGNTLIASQNTRRIIEFDVQGREIWNYNADGQVFNARRR